MNLTFNNLKSFFSGFKIRKYPSKRQWQHFAKTLSIKEKIVFLVFLTLFLGSFLFLALDFYLKNTKSVPAKGGGYVEGIVDQPHFINPIYAQASDVDRDITELIFSGLMKYGKQGEIIPDLAKNYEVKEGGKIYEVELKENAFWSDGEPLTSDDIIFTIETIQGPEYKSPVIANWLGVKVEKISDHAVRFILRNPYAPFLENLTQKIIPKHIWKDISPENFPLAIYNLKAIGSGPYELKNLVQDKQGKIVSLELTRNSRYFGQVPYLSKISFRFYNDEQELIRAYKKGEINSFSLSSFPNVNGINELSNLKKYSIYLPRYFAVFFNVEKSPVLSDKNVRQALNYAIDKDEIIKKILLNQGRIVDSPILPDIYGFSQPSINYPFNPKEAEILLEKAGFVKNESGKRVKIVKKEVSFRLKNDLKLGSQGLEVEELQKCLAKDQEIYPEGTISGYFGENTRAAVINFQEKYAKEVLEPFGLKTGTGIVAKATRDKLNEICFPQLKETVPLKFSIATVNQTVLVQVAEELSKQWAKIGVEVSVKPFDISQLEKEIIKPRNYESVLFGNVMTTIPDPFAFWHSSQTKDPGLNLAMYQNKEADLLLEDIRKTIDPTLRKEKLEQFQNLVLKDSPVIFLYNPVFSYFVSNDIKGIDVKIVVDPSKRFSEIENWYIKTKRVWK